jgi:hypothetical protein
MFDLKRPCVNCPFRRGQGQGAGRRAPGGGRRAEDGGRRAEGGERRAPGGGRRAPGELGQEAGRGQTHGEKLTAIFVLFVGHLRFSTLRLFLYSPSKKRCLLHKDKYPLFIPSYILYIINSI